MMATSFGGQTPMSLHWIKSPARRWASEMRARRLAWAMAMIAVLPGQATAGDDFVEGEVIVTYRQGASLAQAKASAGRQGADWVTHFAWLSEQRKEVIGVLRSSKQSTAALIAKLRSDPEVLVAEPNYIRRVLAFQPDDTYYTRLWGLNNTGQSLNSTSGTSGADTRFAAAWNLSRRGATGEVVVAVLDTGIDPTHPDMIANLWTNAGETPGNNIDDDGNGRIDDVHGFSFVDNSANLADSGNHGTHVAGTIAASGNNQMGIIGVNFKARIMTLKVSSNGTTISTSAVVAALQYAAMMKTRGVNIVAINGSYGGSSNSSAESNAIRAAGDVGIVFCAAAGNDSTNNDVLPVYPAGYRLSNMIVVAAANQSNQLASYSNYGATKVDLVAPGSNIYSLRPTWEGTVASVKRGLTSYAALSMTHAGVTPGITATLVNCGTGNTLAEFPLTVENNIAMIQRGTETFAVKLTHAQNAGAAGAIIYNNVAGPFGGTLSVQGDWLPAVSVSMADGASLLAGGTAPVTLIHSLAAAATYHYLDGTSMAAPHVTGAVALVAMNFPDESAVQRVARIVANTTPVAAFSGKCISGGLLNLQRIIDTKANGLPDWWETDHFGTLGVDPQLDGDGDGMTHFEEFLAGTDPRSSSSRLTFDQTAWVANGLNHDFRLSFGSVSGVTYRVEYNNTLAPSGWTALGGDRLGTGEILHITDPTANARFRRFYRLGVVP